MFYTIVVSDNDPASNTMFDSLLTSKKFVELDNEIYYSNFYKNIQLFKSSKGLLDLSEIDDKLEDSDAYIFLSKHQSKSNIPALTCHFPGNYGSNEYGGKAKELGISFPSLQKAYLKKITKFAPLYPEFDIVIEVTHHGPTSLKKPVIFIEIGSTVEQWTNKNIAKRVSNCILSVLNNHSIGNIKSGIAIGGNHYASKFNNLLLTTDFAIGHIIPKYYLNDVNEDILNQMISKSVEKITCIFLDWKGLGKEKQRIMQLLNNFNLEIIKL
ncbi:MAG: D-aminoacyl-tRNA deacylase [Nitrososphaeraceae archaeon]